MAKKSQKGTYGKVGAPPKDVRIPAGSFTMERAVKLNVGRACELTVRKRVNAAINGFYFTGTGKDKKKVTVPVTHKLGEPIPQPKGGVGRPSYRIVPLDTKVAKTVAPKAKKPTVVKSTPVVNVEVPATVAITPEPVATPQVTTPQDVTVAVETPAAVVTPAPLP